MKILCFSDLHLWEDDTPLFDPYYPKIIAHVSSITHHVSPDVVVVTGDTLPASMIDKVSYFCRLLFTGKLPVVVTLGNHEFWSRPFKDTLELLKTQDMPNKNVTFLDLIGNVEIGGFNFVGGALFFDGSLRVREDQLVDEWRGWPDWRITDIVPEYKEINRYYTDMIRSKMKPGMPTVLCTHHVPHEKLNGHKPGHFNFYTGMRDLVHDLPFDPKFDNYLICGHTHKRVIGEVLPGFMGVNVGSDFDDLKYYVLEV